MKQLGPVMNQKFYPETVIDLNDKNLTIRDLWRYAREQKEIEQKLLKGQRND